MSAMVCTYMMPHAPSNRPSRSASNDILLQPCEQTSCSTSFNVRSCLILAVPPAPELRQRYVSPAQEHRVAFPTQASGNHWSTAHPAPQKCNRFRIALSVLAGILLAVSFSSLLFWAPDRRMAKAAATRTFREPSLL